MFTSIARIRSVARAFTGAALVVALSATSLGGIATASPATEDERGCSVLAHERNAGLHRLHEAWQLFQQELRDMAREARQIQRSARGADAATTLTTDVREDLATAREDLRATVTQAHEDIQGLVELGTVCKATPEAADVEPEITLAALTQSDEDGTVTVRVQFNEPLECAGACEKLFTYTANADEDPVQADAVELDEDGTGATATFALEEDVDVQGAEDMLSFTAGTDGSLTDESGDTLAPEDEEPVDISLATNDLAAKYREVVDQAIKDMQAVMDGVTGTVAEALAAAETVEATDDKAVREKRSRAAEKRTDAERVTPDRAVCRGKGPRR